MSTIKETAQVNHWCDDRQIWQPTILRLHRASDHVAFHRIVSDPQIEIVDRIESQIFDLIKTQNPKRDPSHQELIKLAAQFLGDEDPYKYGTWVYYPWLRKIIHTLDEREFTILRTDRNKYKITPEEQHQLMQRRIGIVGLSAGHAIALSLALERSCAEFRLADFDVLDLSNLNRIPSGISNLGLSKVFHTARAISELDPFLKVNCFPQGLTSENIDAFFQESGCLDLVIDECDSLDMKVSLRHAARRLRIPVVMATSDRGLVDVERFDREPHRPIFHGLLGDISLFNLSDMTTEEKIPFVMRICPLETLSTRGKVSLVEIGESIKAWPQLGSAVMHGGGVIADLARRIALNQTHVSGQFMADYVELIAPQSDIPPGQAPSESSMVASSQRPVAAARGDPDTRQSAIDFVKQRTRDITAQNINLALPMVRQLIEAAILAPSGANLQPWLWIYHDGYVHLFLDRARSGTFTDFNEEGSLVSLGAALENLCIEANALGWDPRVDIFPDGRRDDFVARIAFFQPDSRGESGDACAFSHLRPLIGIRRTNRHLGRQQALARISLERIKAAAESVPGIAMSLIDDISALARLGEIAGAGDRLRILNQAAHSDLVAELRWDREEAERTRDGLPIMALELTEIEEIGLRLMRGRETVDRLHEIGGGRAFIKMGKKAFAGCSAAGLITIDGFARRDFVQAGRAVQRSWLTAAKEKIAWQPMTILTFWFSRLERSNGSGLDDFSGIDLRKMRADYLEIFPDARHRAEAMLCRLFVASDPSVTSLRRRLDDVLILLP